jgi:HEXXH motif-containing protein
MTHSSRVTRPCPGRHELGADEIERLAAGSPSPATLHRLRQAALSKHKLLIEVIRRRSDQAHAPEASDAHTTDAPKKDAAGFGAALAVLDRVRASDPAVVDDLLGLPHVGGWAVDNLHPLMSEPVGTPVTARDERDPGYLVALAMVAAIRARADFELSVRPGGRPVVLPGLGELRPPGDADEVCLRSAPGGGAVAIAGDWRSAVPGGSAWTPVPRVRVEAGGVELDVALDGLDPYLARFGAPVLRPGPSDLEEWREALQEAWDLLVAADPGVAERVAGMLRVIVPLRAPSSGKPLSATSGWTPGAVALSLPGDPLTLAETLVHEAQHGVLGLVEDVARLVNPAVKVLCYAPWRDDPRPPGGLLHGCFAHLGVTGFWRRQRDVLRGRDADRAHFEFARWRQATLDAVRTLLDSGALTTTGARLALGMHEVLASWACEPVPADAQARADHANAAHRERHGPAPLT